jgi:hypothetical protein
LEFKGSSRVSKGAKRNPLLRPCSHAGFRHDPYIKSKSALGQIVIFPQRVSLFTTNIKLFHLFTFKLLIATAAGKNRDYQLNPSATKGADRIGNFLNRH